MAPSWWWSGEGALEFRGPDGFGEGVCGYWWEEVGRPRVVPFQWNGWQSTGLVKRPS